MAFINHKVCYFLINYINFKKVFLMKNNKYFILCYIVVFSFLVSCGSGSNNNSTQPHLYTAFDDPLDITDASLQLIHFCDITSGNIYGCSTESGFYSVSDIAFKNNKAYVLNAQEANDIRLCNISSSGSLISCINAGATNAPDGVSLRINNNYLYIVNSSFLDDSSVITRCTINSNSGMLNNCQFLNNISGLDMPQSIVFVNNYAYISNYGNDTILQCNYNQLSGDVFGCSDSGLTIDSPYGMNVYNNYVYITSFISDDPYISVCSTSITTGLLSCNKANTKLFTGAQPDSIAFYNESAFISNYGDMSVFSLGGIVSCDVNSNNGDIYNCSRQESDLIKTQFVAVH